MRPEDNVARAMVKIKKINFYLRRSYLDLCCLYSLYFPFPFNVIDYCRKVREIRCERHLYFAKYTLQRYVIHTTCEMPYFGCVRLQYFHNNNQRKQLNRSFAFLMFSPRNLNGYYAV